MRKNAIIAILAVVVVAAGGWLLYSQQQLARLQEEKAAPALANEVTLNVWSRQDVSGPLRGGNLITAASRLNKALKKEGSDTRVTVLVRQG
ncbi:MAG: hypothetical protein V3T93_01265, partial [Alphaproteobacteria bacterium]